MQEKKTYGELLDLVEPVQLGHSSKKVNCNYQYIPILETLKFLFKDQSIQEQYLRPLHSEKGVFSDFAQGSVYKSNSFFVNNNDSLKLILFQDTFEVILTCGCT